MITYRALVFGVVQGVGFRYFTAKKATALGVCGRATNLADGSVEVIMQGEEGAVLALLAWLHLGPQTASVERVISEEYNPERLFNGFAAY